jgi:NADPH:quinone reductase-like Zn-dependent oxidoreductase
VRAICIQEHGHPDDLAIMDIRVPDIGDREVLVRIHAAGVGIHDRWSLPRSPRLPYAIGLEGAGVIERVGSAVQGFKAGDRVMYSGMPQAQGGSWAEFAAVSAEDLTILPDELGFIEAAALPVSGTTAIEGVNALGLEGGATVFMAGASGAIGTLALQLAVLRGQRVAASASASNLAYLRSLGAEIAVDYRDPDWAKQVLRWMPGGVDAALAIQPGTGTSSLPVVRDGGKVVTVSGDQVTPERQITVEQMLHHAETRQDLARLANDVAAGHVRVEVEKVYPLERGLEALGKSMTRHARGKIIVTMTPASPFAG